ncbi:F-box/RNI/FBD-like domain protein [Medicago truncatula]|uniref:F-box/RNI/FBD-like domain protein n=1 Tax=Medicago truncatula TaxID=3880 RepID=G7IJX6_MEDTR|nr:F-box/RNI/FBD-like domain protein [Medicago truncatula]
MSKQKISTSVIDRISSFPDDILIRILSSLPIEQACVTSILSKRWTHLWCFVPDLDFTKTKWKDQESYSRFEEFVFSVLYSREAAGNHSINTFILDIEYDSSELLLDGIKNIHKWVDIVVKSKVQNIHLYPHVPLNGEETILPKFPMSSILSCTTLVVLKLRWFNLTVVSDLSIRLPSLKTLHLKEIYFDQQRDFMMLLDGCPVLEDLQLCYIYMTRQSHHSLDDFESSSMLKKLNRADITDCECYFPVKSLSNLEFLRIKLSEVYHPRDFPTFNNLTWLVLNYDWDIVVQVLHHCPKLQNLDLYQVRGEDEWEYEYEFFAEKENWANPKFVPSCLTSNLTTCTMWDFAYAGQQRNHIMLARFILENARVLQTMKIWSNSKRSDIESQLSPCPKASATCQLSINCHI